MTAERPTVLVRHIGWVYPSGDDPQPVIDGFIAASGSKLIGVGPEPSPWSSADAQIDGKGMIAIPGLVNAHHHFFQHLTRALHATQNATFLDWLVALYPIWAAIDRDAYGLAAEAAIAELLLSGSTSTVNMAYLYPDKQTSLLDEDIAAARRLGIRIHEIRGCISVLEAGVQERLVSRVSSALIEDRASVLAACESAVGRFDDPSEYSMVRVGVGPTTIDFDDPTFMRALAEIGAQGGGCHTHLRPREDEELVARERYGMSPLEYLDSVDWLTEATWIAHAARLSGVEFGELARHRTGVVHCPRMLARLGAPVPPIIQASRSGTTVGLGVDGAASNDSGSMLGELRAALMVHRLPSVQPGLGAAAWPTPHEILRMATSGGAALVGRSDIGALEAGKAADFALFDTRQIGLAGALHDPLGGLLFAGDGVRAHTTVVNGRVVVQEGRLLTRNEADLTNELNASAMRLAALGGPLGANVGSGPSGSPFDPLKT